MTAWTRVKWTEAGQVADLAGWDEPLGDSAAEAPQRFFERLVADDRLRDAVEFLAQALPRLEAVAWAVRAVRDIGEPGRAPGASGDADALKAALLWAQDPTDARRRAAMEASERASDEGAERLAALAVFFSGGSIAPADCPPLPAPREAAGRFAAAAVVLAAIRSDDEEEALRRALDAGAAIAVSGLKAATA